MVFCSIWISLVSCVPSVLWHCWLGHLTRKNPSPIWPIMCWWDVKLYSVSTHVHGCGVLVFCGISTPRLENLGFQTSTPILKNLYSDSRSYCVTVRWWPVILLELMWNETWHMKLIITFTPCCGNLWKSIVSGSGKLWEFFSTTLFVPHQQSR